MAGRKRPGLTERGALLPAVSMQDPMTSLVLENREKYIAALQARFLCSAFATEDFGTWACVHVVGP